MRYYLSDTKITDEQVKMLVEEQLVKPWINPKTKVKRYYFDRYGLGQVINLGVCCYKSSGMIRQCQYTNENGERITTSNSSGYRGEKIFIENGIVYSEWTSLGDILPETIARCAIKYVEEINRVVQKEQKMREKENISC